MGVIVFGIVIVLVGFLILFIGNEGPRGFGAFLCAIGGAIFMGGVYDNNMKDIPTAMDVYKGKTTLQITYKDSIPVDSVVVFK